MASSLIVVLLVATGEAMEPSTTMVAKTAQDALDEKVIVVVREVEPARLNDAEAARVGDALDAAALVVIAWRDGRRNAVIHVRSTHDKKWVEKTLTFIDGDPTVERGKAVGFEVAAMLETNTKGDGRDTPPARPTSPPPAVERTRPADEPRLALDLLGGFAWGEGASSIGAELAGRLWALDRFAPRLGVGGRIGDVPEAGATATLVRVAGGIAVRLLRPSLSQPFSMGVRSDALVLWHRVSRETNSSSGARLVGGVTGVLEGSWELTRSLAVLGGVGIEMAFGEVTVRLDDRVVSAIRPFRGIAELGVRFQL